MELLINKTGEPELASLYDICNWFTEKYPEDVFVSKDHPVHQIRDLCKEVLKKRRGKNGLH